MYLKVAVHLKKFKYFQLFLADMKNPDAKKIIDIVKQCAFPGESQYPCPCQGLKIHARKIIDAVVQTSENVYHVRLKS